MFILEGALQELVRQMFVARVFTISLKLRVLSSILVQNTGKSKLLCVKRKKKRLLFTILFINKSISGCKVRLPAMYILLKAVQSILEPS